MITLLPLHAELSCEHPMRSGWPHLLVSNHELTMAKLQWSHGQLILWAHKCEIFVASLWEHSTSLYGSPSGYWRNYKATFVASSLATKRPVESATSQLTHRELTGNSQVWPHQFISWWVRCAASKWCCSELIVWGSCEYIIISPWHPCEIKFFTVIELMYRLCYQCKKKKESMRRHRLKLRLVLLACTNIW